MRKLLTRIIGATLGAALALGVGFGVNNTRVIPAYADSVELTSFTFDFEAETAHRTAGNNSFTSNTYTQLSNNDISLTYADSITTGTPLSGLANICARIAKNTTNSPVVIIGPINLSSCDVTGISYYAKGPAAFSFASSYSIDNVNWTAHENHDCATQATTYGGINSLGLTLSKPSSLYFKISISVAESTNSNRDAFIDNIKFYGAVTGPTITSVSISGDMAKKTYNTVESWDNSGLSADVVMSDSSEYTGSVLWAYNPATPVAAVVANDGDELNDTNISVTATASGKNGDKQINDIDVNYATVAQGLAATPASGTLSDVIVEGVVSRITEVSINNGNATYFISDDGSQNNELQIYRGKYLNNADFTNESQIQLGDIVVVYGDLITHNSTKQFTTGSQLLSKVSLSPSVDIAEDSFSINIGDDDVTVHDTHENIPVGGSLKWASSNTGVATINETTGVLHAVAAGVTQITAKIFNSSEEVVAYDSINVSVIAPITENGSFVKVTKSIDLINGGKYLLVYNDAKAFNGSLTNLDVTLNTIDVTTNEGQITKNDSNKSNYFSLEIIEGKRYLKSASGYYIGRTTDSNGLHVVDHDPSVEYSNTISINVNGNVTIRNQTGGATLQYFNSAANSRFRYYTSKQQVISLYKFVASGSQLINAQSIAAVGGTEEAGVVSNVKLGFGASIPQASWTAINSQTTITNWGIMFVKEETLTSQNKGSVEDAYNAGLITASANIAKSSGDTPYLDGEDFVFNAKINITDVANYGTIFCAAPYIVAGGQYYFLTEMRYSVNTLATYCITNGGSNLSNEALGTLVA